MKSFLTRPSSLTERRRGVLGVIQFVICAVLIATVPLVGIPVAVMTLVLQFNVKQAKKKRLEDLRAEYYPWTVGRHRA